MIKQRMSGIARHPYVKKMIGESRCRWELWKGERIMYDNQYPNEYTNQNENKQQPAGIEYRNYQNGYQGGYNTYQQNQTGTQQNTAGQGAGNPYQQGSTYQTNGGSYQYGSTYSNDYARMDHKKDKKTREKKPRTGGGYFKKALAAVSLGLFFGIFAGLGLYIVDAVSGMSDRADKIVTIEQTEVEAAAKEAVDVGEKTEETASQSTTGIRQTDTVTTVVSDVSDVVAEVMPSIVAVNNHYTETMSYFGQSMSSEADASGSGIIVGQNDTELLIVTNYHVIADTDKLTVQFVEGSEAEALIKGMDPDMDLAVIAVPVEEIESKTLQEIKVATLGDSDSLVVGEPAIAIGNSLGYGQSVTTGVISALDRSIEISGSADGTFIQTDAAINPGNSGGALLNIKGEVIGINSNKIGGSAVEGMGYAIPISAASPIIADLMLKETKSKVAEEERGYLGISGISVTKDVSQAYGMPEGVYIAQVYENTAAARAGLKQGDIIMEFNGDSITSMEELQRELEFYAKGDTVDVKVMTMTVNGYEEATVKLTLGNKVQ